MENIAEVENLLTNVLRENSVELGINSAQFQLLIEDNASFTYNEFLNEENEYEKFYINNKDLKIYDMSTLFLFNICNCDKEQSSFKEYLSVAKSKVRKEIEKFMAYSSELLVNDDAQDIQLDKIDVYVYLIVRNFEELIKVNNVFKSPTRQKIDGQKFSINITARTLPLSSSIDEEIRIDSRIEAIKMKNLDDDIEGYIFTANLYDVTKLYKNIGYDLFVSNLRIGIRDQNKVDESIKNTLLTDHQNFWYYNNGITLIARKESLDFKHPEKLILSYKQIKDFTVVNGAQTINSAANIFYGNNKEFQDKKIKIINNTKVLLRVIVIPEEITKNEAKSRKNYNEVVSKISISLNRQKPITEEDIAYFVPFVDAINYLYKNNIKDKYYFSIVRRGEGEYIGSHEYELLTIARVVKSYLAVAPGPARSLGKKTLLDTKTEYSEVSKREIVYFKQNDIFIDQHTFDLEHTTYENNDNETNENDSGEIRFENYKLTFMKHYKPVNFGVLVKDTLEKINVKKLNNQKELINTENLNGYNIRINDYQNLSNITTDEIAQTINYGKYHIITFLIHALSEFKELKPMRDFSEWNDPNKSLIDEKYLIRVAHIFAFSWKLAYFENNSNLFLHNDMNDQEISIEIIKQSTKVFDSNVFKVSKISNNNSQNSQLSLAYKYFIKYFEQEQKKKMNK